MIYAQHLYRGDPHAAPALALTFARRNDLEQRIGAILRATPGGPAVRRSTEVAVTMNTALIAFAIACTQLRMQPAHVASLSLPQQSARIATPVAPPRSIASTLAIRSQQRSAKPAALADWRVGARAALIELLDDPSPQVRAAAAHSLEQYRNVPAKP